MYTTVNECLQHPSRASLHPIAKFHELVEHDTIYAGGDSILKYLTNLRIIMQKIKLI